MDENIIPFQETPEHGLGIFRSPHLMAPSQSALLIIDVQQRLFPAIPSGPKLAWNICRLIQAANILELSHVVATEQYPQGLGGTIDPIHQQLLDYHIDYRYDKMMFSCRECQPIFQQFDEAGVRKVLLTGIETHVCVAQTAFDMLAAGFDVYVAVDAVGSRQGIDHDTALRRLESQGGTLTTTEAVMFEWCERAGTERFKQISALVRQTFEQP